MAAACPDDIPAVAANLLRVAIFGTHPKQFNGYSKVVYELCKAVRPSHGIELHVFGFQNFYNHPGHRKDVPASVTIYDAFANETPKAQGFGVNLVKEYVTRVRPDVCIIFNDLMVLTSVLNELKDAPNRKEFKVIAYIDQVYRASKKDFVALVNQHADAAIAFTPEWRDCILSQGLKLPCYFLPHGFNPTTYFPVPRALARRFFGLQSDDFLVLNLNRNQPRKRWDTCLQAFAEVVKRLPDAPIKLVVGTELKGAWDIMDVFERELKKRGVPVEKAAERIVVPGHPQMLTDEETNILYNIADIGINTCDGEGFGLCNFEQAAIGIPQVIPRVGGFVHIFDEEPAIATLVEPMLSIYVDSARDGVGGEAQLSHPNDYADAICKLYAARGSRDDTGKGSASLLARFGWDTIAAKLSDIVHEVCPARAPAAAAAAAAALPCAERARDNVPLNDALLLLTGSRPSLPVHHPPPTQTPTPPAPPLTPLASLPVHNPPPTPAPPLTPPAPPPTPAPPSTSAPPPPPPTPSSAAQKTPTPEEIDELRQLRERINAILGA